jgi:hypothetical protein
MGCEKWVYYNEEGDVLEQEDGDSRENDNRNVSLYLKVELGSGEI